MRDEDPEHQTTPTSRTKHRRWRWAALAVVLVALGIGLAACGGGSPSASSNGSPSASNSSSKLEAQLLKFAQCMRSHGDPSYPDPVIGSNGQPHLGGTPSKYQAPTPQFTAAKAACYQYTPAGSETPAEKTAALAKAVKFAACMRSHGEPNFPDPDSGGQFEFTNTNIDTNSPQFQSAEKTCQTLDPGLQLPTSSSGS